MLSAGLGQSQASLPGSSRSTPTSPLTGTSYQSQAQSIQICWREICWVNESRAQAVTEVGGRAAELSWGWL